MEDTDVKICVRCKEKLPLSEFYRDKRRREGVRSYCKPCYNSYRTDYWRKNPEKHPRIRKVRSYTTEYQTDWRLSSVYGITRSDYDALVEKQRGLCAICRLSRPLFVDHDHNTKKVRGLLCSTCNSGIGLLGDTLNRVQAALDYILAAEEILWPV